MEFLLLIKPETLSMQLIFVLSTWKNFLCFSWIDRDSAYTFFSSTSFNVNWKGNCPRPAASGSAFGHFLFCLAIFECSCCKVN